MRTGSVEGGSRALELKLSKSWILWGLVARLESTLFQRGWGVPVGGVQVKGRRTTCAASGRKTLGAF